MGANSIRKPGYHIRPEYDLHGLRRRRNDEHKGHIAGELPLVSLIDMFSMLVIYLLMNFSATGEVFYLPKNITLPTASNSETMLNAPLLSVVEGEVSLDAAPAGEGTARVSVADRDANLAGLVAALTSLKASRAKPGESFSGRLNLQADESLQLMHVKRAMQAAVASGWTNINFVVRKPESTPAR